MIQRFIYIVNPRLTRGIRSSKAARSVNPRWKNLILYGINGDTGTRPWSKKIYIFMYELRITNQRKVKH
jgi:hypothetical protein